MKEELDDKNNNAIKKPVSSSFENNTDEKKDDKEEKKSLNQRIEDLVVEIERANKVIKKEFSFKRIFLKGLLQGLGIVIGSTVLAGLLYSFSTKFIDKEFIKENTLKYILEKEK